MKKSSDYIKVLTKIIKKFSVSEAYIFGSYVDTPENFNDIDVGVVMIDKKQFFVLYSELIENIDIPVDLICLNDRSKFNSLILRDGVKIYG